MTNIREELLEHIDDKEVEYVSLALDQGYDEPSLKFKGELSDVIDSLDISYDSGYGGQELFGYIWYTDGTWSSRGEYDGSEWWLHNVRPALDVKVKTDWEGL